MNNWDFRESSAKAPPQAAKNSTKQHSTTKLTVPVLNVSTSTAEQYDEHNIIYMLQICELSVLLGYYSDKL